MLFVVTLCQALLFPYTITIEQNNYDKYVSQKHLITGQTHYIYNCSSIMQQRDVHSTMVQYRLRTLTMSRVPYIELGSLIHRKKDIPVPCRDVTYQTLPGQE